MQTLCARYVTVCLQAATWMPAEADGWRAAAAAAEKARDQMVARCKSLFDFYAAEHEDLPGD